MERQKVRWNQATLLNNTAPNLKIDVDTDCADIIFTNLSNVNGSAGSVYLVNNQPIAPGASITFGCNQNEILTGHISVQGAAANGNEGLWVQRKYYIN